MELEFLFEEGHIYALGKANKILAEITYHETGNDTIDIDHTFVDNSLRGQGVASDLVAMAVDAIQRQGKRVTASCSYAAKWLETHPH